MWDRGFLENDVGQRLDVQRFGMEVSVLRFLLPSRKEKTCGCVKVCGWITRVSVLLAVQNA